MFTSNRQLIMVSEIRKSIENYKKLNDVHHYKIMLGAADMFIESYPNGVETAQELDLGIDLFKELVSLTYITSLREYENDTDLYREILYKKLIVFKLCIPASHSKLRGLTEMLVGMKENELG